MSFFLSCPRCKQWVEVDRHWVGSLTTCPHCSADFVVPDASPAPGSARPSPESSAKAAPQPAKRWYEQLEDEREANATTPVVGIAPEVEPDIDISLPAPIASGAWRRVRGGLTVIYIAMIVAFVTLTVFLLVGLSELGWGGRRPVAPALLPVLGLLLVGEGVFGFVGQCLCCTAPEHSRLRGKAVASTLCAIGAAIMFALWVGLGFVRQGPLHEGRMQVGGEFLIIGLLTIILSGAGVICWVLFLRDLGRHFQNPKLAQSAQLYFLFFIVCVLATFCMHGSLLSVPDDEFSKGQLGLTAIFFAIFYVWLLSMVVQARNTIASRS
ncbi:MAG: hypothetical protein HY040_12070 [Planctomycetes bacterium]|nr:hypothetical protein [Planctomycetota bacterium]